MHPRTLLMSMLLALSIIALAASGAHAGPGGGKGGGGGGGGNGGGGGGGGGEPVSRIAYSAGVAAPYSSQVFTIQADGSGTQQFTTGASDESNWACDWSVDGVLTVHHRLIDGTQSWLRVLDIGDGSDPSATIESAIIPIPEPGGCAYWSAHTDSSGAVLPSNSQRLAYVSGSSQGNISVIRDDGSDPIQVTNYVETYLPPTSYVGEEYRFDKLQWLPDGPNDTIGLYYMVERRTHVADGPTTYYEPEHRVITMDASSWPSLTVISDELLTFSGSPVPVYESIKFSRDGSRAAWLSEVPGEDRIIVSPVTYDAATGHPTIDAGASVYVADDGSPGKVELKGIGGFSADNSQIAYHGQSRRKGAVVTQLFVTSALSNGDSSFIAHEDPQSYTSNAVWGP